MAGSAPGGTVEQYSGTDTRSEVHQPEKRASRKATSHTVRDGSKKADIRLLERAKGGTLAELMTATGWQAHSVCGFISGTLGKRLKMKIDSFRTEKRRPCLPREGVTRQFRLNSPPGAGYCPAPFLVADEPLENRKLSGPTPK